jgi:thymidine kinase
MNNVLLGKAGSGKTRYLYSLISNYLFEGKKGAIISDNRFSVTTFVSNFFNKYGDTVANREKINNITIFDTIAFTIENITYFLEDAKERGMDFIVIDASNFLPDLIENSLILNYDGIDLFFVGSSNRHFNFNSSYKIDKFSTLFDNVITIEKDEIKEILLLTTRKIVNGELIIIEEKIYGLQSLIDCDFH